MFNPLYTEINDVHSRLKQLGLTVDSLLNAIEQGYLSRTRLTAHHPKIFYGLSMWAETVAALRDNLRPTSWFKVDDSNYEITVNEDSTIAIAVTTGDENTGLAAFTPSNKCPKGAYTVDAVATNQQLDLFADLLPPPDEESCFTTWILLVHVAENEVRSELSLPSEMVGGKIKTWKERIILPTLPKEKSSIAIAPPDVPEIDVPVLRKSKA